MQGGVRLAVQSQRPKHLPEDQSYPEKRCTRLRCVSCDYTNGRTLVPTKLGLVQQLISLLVECHFPALLQCAGEFEDALVLQPQFCLCPFGQAARGRGLDVERDVVGPEIRLLVLYGQERQVLH